MNPEEHGQATIAKQPMSQSIEPPRGIGIVPALRHFRRGFTRPPLPRMLYGLLRCGLFAFVAVLIISGLVSLLVPVATAVFTIALLLFKAALAILGMFIVIFILGSVMRSRR